MQDPTPILPSDLIDVVTIGVLFATAIILYWTYKSHNNQLFTSNFSVMTSYIGSDVTKKCRGVLYQHKELIDKLEQNPESKTRKLTTFDINENIQIINEPMTGEETRLRAMLEVIKYIASTYNRVGMLTKKNKDLKKEIIDYHGFVIGKMWIITENVVKQQTNWELGYKYFKKSYDDVCKNADLSKKLEAFKSERNKQNTNNLP